MILPCGLADLRRGHRSAADERRQEHYLLKQFHRVVVSCGLGRDRKSTRLNSSHDQISYAVFCLKKKKYKYNGALQRLQVDHMADKPMPVTDADLEKVIKEHPYVAVNFLFA